MKVLFVNTNDYLGGAARSAYRLFDSLVEGGTEAGFFVQDSFLRESRFFAPQSGFQRGLGKVRPTLSKLPVRVAYGLPETPFSLAWLPTFGRFHDVVRMFSPDILHIHWIGDGAVTFEEIRATGRPVVWTMHDSWLLTGGCHIPYECRRYLEACGKCPQLKSSNVRDLSAHHFRAKKKFFSGRKDAIVSPSKWLYEKSQLGILSAQSHYHIPNLIPAGFKPFPRDLSRKSFGLPQDRKLVLFGAMGADSDPNKGYDLLQGMIQRLPAELKGKIDFVIFGGRQRGLIEIFGFRAHHLGMLFDEVSLPLLYSAADVTILPSRSENFPNVILESMACGTPAVGFAVGGLMDLLSPSNLATPFDPGQLAHTLMRILDESGTDQARVSLAEETHRRYGISAIIPQYLGIYESLVRMP